MFAPSQERQRLLQPDGGDGKTAPSPRRRLYDFLEGNTPVGQVLEAIVVLLIIVNVLCFILSTESSLEDNETAWYIFNAVEICTVSLFTTEYALRFYSIVEETDANGTPLYSGLGGRLRWAVTDFYSWVDLASIVPFYVDIIVAEDLPATQFIRLARMLRMMEKGGFASAFAAFGDIYRQNRKLIYTASFVGLTVWLMLASFYHLAERHNPEMIWVYPSCYYAPRDGPESERDGRPDCQNRYNSILSSAYFALLNLFGEFPLMDNHSTGGRLVGVFAAVVGVAVFAIPTGILGAGFEDMIQSRKQQQEQEQEQEQGGIINVGGEEIVVAPSWKVEEGLAPSGESPWFSFLDSTTSNGRMYRNLLTFVIAVDVVAFFTSTLPSLQGSNVESAGFAFALIEVVSVLILTFDFATRVVSAGASSGDGVMRYLLGFSGVVDLLSILPFYLSLPAFGGPAALSPALLPTLVRSLQLIRMLKLERYVKAFSVFDDVLRDNLDILAVSGFFALVVWVFASALLYYTERAGPDPEVTPYYQSVPMSMWVTLINLGGEAPFADYTVWGKIITAFMGVFGVAVFAVPVGLLGAGFEEWADSIESKGRMELRSKPSCGAGAVDGINGGLTHQGSNNRFRSFRRQLYAFLEARTTAGQWFETFVMVIIFVTVTQVIVMTMPSVCPDQTTHCSPIFDQIELVAVIIFTIEYMLRWYAAPEAFPESSPWVARLRYMFSFYAIIDCLAVFPYYLALSSAYIDRYDNYLRLLRLLRLLKFDKYTPFVSLIDDVFNLKAGGLLVAGFASSVVLAWFATIMYLVERDDYENTQDCFSEAQRFSSVWNTLQYDLILLTGDYPLVDFSLPGRFVNFLQLMLAVGVVAVPSALIANGFFQILEDSRKQKHARRRSAAVKLQATIRGHLARKQFLHVVEGAQKEEQERKRQAHLLETSGEHTMPRTERAMRACYRFSTGLTDAGKKFDTFVGTLIWLNVIAVIAESEPALGDMPGPAGERLQFFFDTFEAFSVLVFTAEVGMRLFIAPISSKCGFSRWNYLCSFYGIVDLGSIAPWYVEVILGMFGINMDVSVFRILRLFRILQLEHFMSAFSLLDDVWIAVQPTLAATGLLALVLWVGSACLFYLFEKDNECTGDAFSSIPDAMFYTAVFLNGEWAKTDFTWPGKILCCILCVMGIALFAIPVGTVFEAFQDVLQEVNCPEEDEDLAPAASKQAPEVSAKAVGVEDEEEEEEKDELLDEENLDGVA